MGRKKGSPRDYDAETGCLEQLAQKSQLGEPHECYPLYLFRDGHTIRFLSLKTGAARDVPVKDWQLNNGDWSADGKSLYMQSFSSTGVPVVLNVDEEGKAEVVLQGAANTGFWCLIQSPDGRHAIVGEVLPGDNNVWMVDNF